MAFSNDSHDTRALALLLNQMGKDRPLNVCHSTVAEGRHPKEIIAEGGSMSQESNKADQEGQSVKLTSYHVLKVLHGPEKTLKIPL